jgi:TolA-binding protein
MRARQRRTLRRGEPRWNGPAGRPLFHRLRGCPASAITVVLAAVAGWAIFAMHANEQRARSWQRRAQKLEANSKQLEALLAARTRLLNERIDQLNRIAGKLKLSQVALNQSQGDVSSLEERQRQLANEKAQLQDQQRGLDNVAGAYVTCKQDLVQLLSDVANGYDTTYSYGTANTDCTNADTSLQRYLSAYPNG